MRMAIGAMQGAVLRLVIVEGSRLALLGIALGLAGAFALTGVLRGMLYGVTFTGAALILGAVAIFASLVPAWRLAYRSSHGATSGLKSQSPAREADRIQAQLYQAVNFDTL